MMQTVNIVEYEDPSLQKLLSKTASELNNKYNKQRKINEKLLKKNTPLKKFFSIVLDFVCLILFIIGFVVCFSTINTTLHGYVPNFAGFSNLIISSESMVASGYNVGDVAIVHSVDAKTLNVDDKIAFYVYSPSYQNFNVANAVNISSKTNKTAYTLTFKQLFGFQTDEFVKAEKSNCDIVFHHVREIYQDSNGEVWLKTYGSSNSSDDSWWINEKYVIGIADERVVAKSVIGMVKLASKPYGVIAFSIPVGVLIVSIILTFFKNVQIAKLELDCVEEKRKITDEICVKNNIGYQMSEKTKLKILAQATDDNREEYVNLLWKNPPNSIKKYYLRKKLQVSTNQELLKLNRECEQMFKAGENHNKIAQYYLTQKQEIEKKCDTIRKRIKSIDKYKSKATSQIKHNQK